MRDRAGWLFADDCPVRSGNPRLGFTESLVLSTLDDKRPLLKVDVRSASRRNTAWAGSAQSGKYGSCGNEICDQRTNAWYCGRHHDPTHSQRACL